nr:uncharacterized protein CI109_002122 [Kwoniella shandongensis]KAA5529696.1 hypothetical protein CI109_002122 [Kwoniella shandongensis]
MPPRKASGSRQRVGQVVSPVPTTYPGLINGKGMEEDKWQACKEILEQVYKAKHGTRKLADIFRELPDKELYEDYYEAIPEPECLDNIATQLANQIYPNPELFFKQLHLVFLNAKHYNEDESLIWGDAKRLEDQIQQEWKTRAEAGIFSSPDPYHSSPVKPGRKPKRATSANPSKSSTPLPEPIKAPTPLPEPPKAVTPIPEVPTPKPVPVIVPPVVAAMTRTQSDPRPPISHVSPSPSEQYRQRNQNNDDKRIMAARDATLPRWQGPQAVLPGAANIVPGSGWFGEGAPDYERNAGGSSHWPERIKIVLNAVGSYRDPSGQRLAEVLDLIPSVADIPYLSFQHPLSFASIDAAAKGSRYPSLRDFDMEMSKLFEKGRRWFPDGSAEYGKVLVLQRLYNALTAPYPMNVPPSGVPAPSTTLFASLPAGPGNARSLHETTQELRAGAAEEEVGFGITTFRVGTKDRNFTEEARYKGMSYRVGDYVHLINPDDATRPIIGQIFKTFVPTRGFKTHHVTVCWYYRPEQTVHPADRMFYEREVFKTGHFCDHPVEDILEKISVQFFVKYIRGRPRPGEYYPGWPLYVCHSRFNDREYITVRIKNWNSCIPDDLRQTDFMSVIPFERIIDPPMVKSPFLLGVQGPGFVGEPRKAPGGGGEEDEEDEEERQQKRKERTVRPPAPLPAASYAPPPTVPGPSRLTAATPTPPIHRPAAPQSVSAFPTRTIAAIMGGPQVMEQVAIKETLPPDTARLFERDSRGQVLWFSGPPLAPGTIPIPQQQAHSVEYLTYLTKRKRGDLSPPTVRAKRVLPQNGSVKEEGEEDLSQLWWAQGQNADQIATSLQAMMDSV